MRSIPHLLFAALFLPILCLVAATRRRTSRRLVWGPIPVINIKYWSAALAEGGWESETLVGDLYSSINVREDFDRYYEDFAPRRLRHTRLGAGLGLYLAFLYVLRTAGVLHIPFSGGPLGATPLWRYEASLLARAGVATVVIPYGADVFQYSRIPDPVVRNALLLSYPEAGRREKVIRQRVEYWTRHAGVIVVGFTTDGLGRWDVPVGNALAIDTTRWQRVTPRSSHDGKTGPVTVMHAPNHRGAKGTRFIIDAVDQLRCEGLDVQLDLVERVKNDEVRIRMAAADIFADQLLLPGYGLAAVEAMSLGLPVLSNLDDPQQTRVFRIFSFLDECPIISATPETVLESLRELVVNPGLRASVGKEGEAYTAQRHSFASCRALFEPIYQRLLEGTDVDLMNLFSGDARRQAKTPQDPESLHPGKRV